MDEPIPEGRFRLIADDGVIRSGTFSLDTDETAGAYQIVRLDGRPVACRRVVYQWVKGKERISLDVVPVEVREEEEE